MENLSEKQSPDFKEMRKTLAGLGNVLVQSELADNIKLKHYESIGDLSFECGDFKYDVNVLHPYDEESYRTFLKSVDDYLREKVKNYEERIFKLECAKAVIEVYLTDKEK